MIRQVKLNSNDNKIFQWAVVGAGPAGIATIGKLLDNGIPAKQILWCDPSFNVGDLGTFWSNVSSNTKVQLFTNFLYACASFSYESAADNFSLNRLNPEDTCTLKYVVEPLQWISEQLVKQVDAQRTTIRSMSLSQRLWTLSDNSQKFRAQNVVLATGALPSSLNYPGVDVLPFDRAIDKELLLKHSELNKTYAVFGSSHSAIIILRYLVEMGVKKVINFYRSPCRYALDMGDWTLFDNTGLKGHTAQWARDNIDGVPPANLVRCNTTEPNISRFLPECDKVIYAVGFERRSTIVIGDYEDAKYNPHVGIIGPGLFGFGIAYPEIKADPFGSVESQVGLWKFMTYLNRVLPLWFKYHT
jgi:hypothetical protein